MNSCTAAMHLALEAIGLKRGDEVITTPYTFAATAEVIRYFDAKPVLVDVDPLTLNLNLNLVEPAISGRTKAILPVHIAGYPADMDGIFAIARKHGVAVIEDAAHADPGVYKRWSKGGKRRDEDQTSEVRGQKSEVIPLGRDFGGVEPASRALRSTAACFSFYATKTITTGEGGMICTDDDVIAERCRIMALHGISRDAWKRYSAEGSWYYEITAPGYKYNMTDVAAAMGLAQLRKAERMLRRRTEIAERYNKAFRENPSLQIPTSEVRGQKSEARDQKSPTMSGQAEVADNVGTGGSHSWHLYMLRLNLDESREGVSNTGSKQIDNSQRSTINCQRTLRIDRAQFMEELKARNIGASVHFIPLHLHPYYRETYGYVPEDFPVAYREYMREISLPIYSKMTDGDIEDVIAAVLDIVAKNAR